jgi:predicted nucleic acid-binding Zn ribbon protein
VNYEWFFSNLLGLALRGTAISEAARALFFWDADGKPMVIACADSPIAAICLSIHIDRNFSLRRSVQCIRCGGWLDQIRGRDRFCSRECRNYYTTKQRRTKLKLLAQGAEAWDKLSAQRKSSQDQWQWIAACIKRQSDGGIEVEPSWVRQQLTKMKTQKQKKPSRKQGLHGGKNVTEKTR